MQETRLPGPLPDLLAAKIPGMVPLDPDMAPWISDFWLFYHESRRNDPGIRRALDWIVCCFEDLADSTAASAANR